jgi:hypothetical protein
VEEWVSWLNVGIIGSGDDRATALHEETTRSATFVDAACPELRQALAAAAQMLDTALPAASG